MLLAALSLHSTGWPLHSHANSFSPKFIPSRALWPSCTQSYSSMLPGCVYNLGTGQRASYCQLLGVNPIMLRSILPKVSMHLLFAVLDPVLVIPYKWSLAHGGFGIDYQPSLTISTKWVVANSLLWAVPPMQLLYKPSTYLDSWTYKRTSDRQTSCLLSTLQSPFNQFTYCKMSLQRHFLNHTKPTLCSGDSVLPAPHSFLSFRIGVVFQVTNVWVYCISLTLTWNKKLNTEHE